jgi:hypothetical protein
MKVERSYYIDMSEYERGRIVDMADIGNGVTEAEFISHVQSLLNDAFNLGMLEASKQNGEIK